MWCTDELGNRIRVSDRKPLKNAALFRGLVIVILEGSKVNLSIISCIGWVIPAIFMMPCLLTDVIHTWVCFKL